jgi:hypothetical protein
MQILNLMLVSVYRRTVDFFSWRLAGEMDRPASVPLPIASYDQNDYTSILKALITWKIPSK